MATKFNPDAARWVLSCTDAGLTSVVGAGAFGRAENYADKGKVIAVDTADRGRVIMGTVAGNGLAPYQCLVTFKGEDARGEPRWASRCTCPVSQDCKHVVATLLAVRRHLHRAGPSQVETGRDNVVPLFGEQEAQPASDWRGRLQPVLPASAARASSGQKRSPSSTAWRADLGIQFEARTRRTSLTDSTPVQRIEMRPTKLMRTGRWSRTVSWVDVRAEGGVPEANETHEAVLRRVPTHHRPRVGSGQTMYLDELDAGVWDTLRACVEAGVRLMLAATPGEGVTVGEPAEIALGVHHRENGLVLTGDVTGVDLEPESGSATLIGDPPHGVAVLEAGRLRLVPFHDVPHPVVRPLLLGDVIEVPEEDVAEFETTYLPQLRELTTVSDTSQRLADPVRPCLVIEITPLTVGKAIVKTFFRYGDRRIPSAPGGRGRQVSSERAVVARAAVLLGRLRLTRSVPGFEVWVKGSAELTGMEAVRLADAVPELRALDDVEVVTKGELPAYEEAEDDPIVEVGVNEAGPGRPDWLSLQVNVSIDGQEVPFPNLVEAIHRGEETMMLPSGTFFRLDSPQLLEIAKVLDEAQSLQDRRSEKVEISRYDIGLWDQLVGLGVVEEQKSQWQRNVEALVQKGSQHSDAEPPAEFTATLRPYQLEGFRWLSSLWGAGLGGVLADDMGLGKTMQTLAMLERARVSGELEAAPVLVVAPTSVIGVWQREAARFAPHLSVLVLGETSTKRGSDVAAEVAAKKPDVVLTSYAVLRLDADAFHAVSWRGLVLDEAQAVKNYRSQTFQAAKKIGAPFGLAISGTPLENSVMDVWALFNLVAPGLFPTPENFIRTYRKPIEQGEGHVASEALAQLRRRIAPLMLRRRKQDVAPDLPEKQMQVVQVEMSPAHARVYKRHLRREQQRVMGLLKDPDANRVEILAALTRLRRLALDPALVDEEFAGRSVSRKVEAVVEQLAEITGEGHRALVFSQFTDFLSIVRQAAADAGVSSSYLDGSTRHRQEVIEEFTSGETDTFFISLKAGGTGLTLTEADYVIVLDPWWNPAAEDQAIDRAHRIGQTRNVMVYRYVSAATIEEKVIELQNTKRKLFADVIDAGAAGGKLTSDDISSLLA